MPVSPALFEQPWPEGEYRMFQLGFVVDDVIAAAHRWAVVQGVGPFVVLPRTEVPCMYHGVESGVDLQLATSQAGPVQIELIQQFCDRPSVYRDHVPAGTAFHQVCTVTPGYDEKKAHYEHRGYELVSEIVNPHHRVAYFDTYAHFGFFTEVVEQTAKFLEMLGRAARVCADWDGTDPVRLLTKDGYRTPTGA